MTGSLGLKVSTCVCVCQVVVIIKSFHCVSLRIRRYAQNVKRSSKEVQEMYEKEGSRFSLAQSCSHAWDASLFMHSLAS